MRTGAAISGGIHLALLAVALFGVDWFTDRDETPLNVTEIEFIDGTDFDALVSSAPTVPTDKPSDLTKPGAGDPAPARPETPRDSAESSDAPVLTEAPTPEERPDPPKIAFNTPTNVPTEAPKPSIAKIPSPDPLERKSAEPESPPATEPVAPLAASAPTPEARPTKPPEPEPEPKETEKVEVTAPSETAENTRTPDPTPANETDPESTAETSPEAAEGPAPREARLPLARPADLAAAAEAARREEEERIARETPEKEPERTAPAPERTTPQTPEKPAATERTAAANTRQGPPLNASEKNALRVGIQKHYYYTGDTSDRSLQVKVVVELSEAGEIVGKPRVVDAASAAQNALGRAGARALLKAADAGEFKRLPRDKYDRWKRLNVIFTVDQTAAVSG